MLVLTRNIDESIVINGGEIVVKVIRVDKKKGKVRIGIQAPVNMRVDREEVHAAIESQKSATATATAKGE